MTIRQIVHRFRKHKPETELDALIKCRIGLRHIGSGYFRNVYRVDDLPLVVKFPDLRREPDDGVNETPVEHSGEEIRAIKRLKRLKKYHTLRKYLPEVYYMDDTYGVVLMGEYKPLDDENEDCAIAVEVGEYIGGVINCEDWDYQPANLGRDAQGNIKIIDFGRLIDV